MPDLPPTARDEGTQRVSWLRMVRTLRRLEETVNGDDDIQTKTEALDAMDRIIEKLSDTYKAQYALRDARRVRRYLYESTIYGS